MELKRAGSQASVKGSSDYFTGDVRIDPLNAPPPPARVSCASVTFEPGARSAWHRHPLGQTLIVTAGCGWTQCEGESIVEIRAGDVIWCPPGAQALARRDAVHVDDAHRRAGSLGRKKCRMARESQRRAIPHGSRRGTMSRRSRQ